MKLRAHRLGDATEERGARIETVPTGAQRKLLALADASGRLPACVSRPTLQACLARGWVESRRSPRGEWLGRFVTDPGRAALATEPAPRTTNDPPRPQPPGSESLAAAARRTKLCKETLRRWLLDAQAYAVLPRTNGRRKVWVDPALVDRVVAAHQSTPAATQPDATSAYDGPCDTCIAVMECTGGRALTCPWCKRGHPPWCEGMPPTRAPGDDASKKRRARTW